MIPIWQYFLLTDNSTLLTLALITNEQQYVEKHLLSKKKTKESIFNTISYILQEKMGLTHVIFPYKRYPFLRFYSLAGLEIHEFSSVLDRVKTGKQLYSILFSKLRYDSILRFANKFSHTGSRHDYWPHLFSKSIKDVHKNYSPSLPNSWKNVSHQFPKSQDWFSDLSQVINFDIGITMEQADITKNVKRDLNMLLALGKIKKEISCTIFNHTNEADL